MHYHGRQAQDGVDMFLRFGLDSIRQGVGHGRQDERSFEHIHEGWSDRFASSPFPI